MTAIIVAALIVGCFIVAAALERILFAMLIGFSALSLREIIDSAMQEKYGESWVKYKERMIRKEKFKVIKGGKDGSRS